MWNNKSWILHKDNTAAHTTLYVKTFLDKYNITKLYSPPYWPDLVLCDFYLLLTVDSELKLIRFQTVEAMKEKVARVMKELTEEYF